MITSPSFRLVGPIITILVLFTFISIRTAGAPLYDIPMKLIQPDGSVLYCFASGDEFHNWLHDENGFTIIQHPENGFYVYAVEVNGSVKATEYVAGRLDPVSVGLSPHANIPADTILRIREDYFEHMRQVRIDEFGIADEPLQMQLSSGKINNIVIFIRFSTDSEFTDGISFYENLYNSKSPNTSSLYNYYMEASYGQLEIESHFFPIQSGSFVFSYRDANPRGYYMPYNAVTNPIGYDPNIPLGNTTNQSGRTFREHTLLRNAVNSVSASIPTNINLDSNNNGRIDCVSFIIRGGPEGGWNSLLWPHKWTLHSQQVFIHGKRVWDYTFQLERTGFPHFPIQLGVIAHEMFHVLGAPDLYRYTNTTLTPVGPWDLMALTRSTPQHMGAYMKFYYGGWIEEIPVITESGHYEINPLTNPINNSFKILSPNSTSEYFVIEYRKKNTIYENIIPGEGLIIYRINTSVAGNGNAYGPPDEVYIYRPNGTNTVNGSLWSAHYSSTVGRTALSDSTSPSAFLSDDSPGGITIYDIGAPGETITFRIELKTGTVADIDGNEYQTVLIGDQWWMAENLRVTRYRNGDEIPTDLTFEDWNNSTYGAYTIHPYENFQGINSDKEMLDAYGALYNWYALNDSRGLCPKGWRVPSDDDWGELVDFIGGNTCGGSLKSTRTEPDPHPRWQFPNTGATNTSGFSGLPGGQRGVGIQSFIGSRGYWWTSTEEHTDKAKFRYLEYRRDFVYSYSNPKVCGYSVRCIRKSEFFETYKISGVITINGVGLAGATITASGGHSHTATTNLNGKYTISGIPEGTTVTITPSHPGYSFTPQSRQVTYISQNITDINFIATDLLTLPVNVSSGWNLVGIPLEVIDDHYKSLFPNAIDGTLYSFDGSYKPETIMEPGTGYWLRFNADETVEITGLQVDELTLSLIVGWNMISGLSNSVPLGEVNDPDGIIIQGTLYEFVGTYNPSTEIQPGKGYWIRTNTAGTIGLSSGSGAPGSIAKTADYDETLLTSALEGFDRITLRNPLGIELSLYFGGELPENIQRESYSLPPAPPGSAFDVRFSDGYYVSEYNEAAIHFQGASYPLFLTFYSSRADEMVKYLIIETEGNKYRLTDGESLEITVPAVRMVKVQRIGEYEEKMVPTEYSLSQNYPNPFNPTTTIRYALPHECHVKLEVFNILGHCVRILVAEEQPAGYYEVVFDGETLPSGVYIYRFMALSPMGLPSAGDEFVSIKKFVYLK